MPKLLPRIKKKSDHHLRYFSKMIRHLEYKLLRLGLNNYQGTHFWGVLRHKLKIQFFCDMKSHLGKCHTCKNLIEKNEKYIFRNKGTAFL